MARRYHEIKGLAEFTAKAIVSDEREWKKFLHTAGHMYKSPFREQMLIYAQRPDATACASLITDPKVQEKLLKQIRALV